MKQFKKNPILIVGYGSIGKTHFKLLKEHLDWPVVDVVTSQQIEKVQTYKALEMITAEQLKKYQYFIICSETDKHFSHLQYIDQRVYDKLIIVEKPLFAVAEEYYPVNKVCVAYNLRFHPIIKKLKDYLKREDILTFSARVGQYLPTWRPQQDYRQSYSANIRRGGGVLRDLSHELDYVSMLCGKFDIVGVFSGKFSALDIQSDDICMLLCKNNKNTGISIHLDYLAFQPKRTIEVQTNTMTITADLINNTMIVCTKDKKKQYSFSHYDKNYSYIQMHSNILEKFGCDMSSYNEAYQINLLIDDITNNYMEIK